MTLPEHIEARSTSTEEPAQANAPTQIKIISHAEMNDAYDAGLVTPLGKTIAYAVHYQGTWWIHFERGWIRSDKALADSLDTESIRIAGQDAIVARSASLRETSHPTPPETP